MLSNLSLRGRGQAFLFLMHVLGTATMVNVYNEGSQGQRKCQKTMLRTFANYQTTLLGVFEAKRGFSSQIPIQQEVSEGSGMVAAETF